MNVTFPTCPDELNREWLASALGRTVENFETHPIGGGKGNLGDLVLVALENGEQVVAKFAANRQEALNAAKDPDFSKEKSSSIMSWHPS